MATKLSSDQLIAARSFWYECGRNVEKTGKEYNLSPQTICNYRDKFQTVAEAWEAIREKRHDYVENALHKLIRDGNVTAIIFYLKTQAKDRGYVERQELTGAGGDSLIVKLGWGDNADA